MIVKFPGFQSSALVACLFLALGSCGGSGGSTAGGSTATSDFLTADTQGVSGDVTQAGPNGAAGLTNKTEDVASAAQDLASEIEAADLYRVDGDRLFLLNSYRGLILVDLATKQITGRLAFKGSPSELYVSGDRAFVLLTRFDGNGELLDVSLANPAVPELSATLPLSGAPFTSRKIGDRLVVVMRSGTECRVDSFHLGASVKAVDDLLLPTYVDYAHASDGRLFLATNIDGCTFVQIVDTSNTAGQLGLRGSIMLMGTISAEDRLDFGGGILRVVTRNFSPRVHAQLYTVDVTNPDEPHVRGTLDVGHGEQPFAVRFVDERGYIVTFLQIDPLWVIDLSNPDLPVVSGELTTPGWSSQLVAWGDRLVALGADPTGGWHTTVSLFDVSNPAAPTLASRVSIGSNGSPAFSDPKAFGVFPDSGLVLVPGSDLVQGLAVVDLQPNALSLRGWIDAGEMAQRGFPHAAGVCAITSTGVSIADPANLSSVDKIVVAEDVIDVARIGASATSPGRVATLTADGVHARLGNVLVPLSPERMHVHGTAAAVTGWDDVGRAAYVVDFATPTPTVSARIDLGVINYGYGGFVGQGGDLCIWAGHGSRGFDATATPDGRLVVRGITTDAADLEIGAGEVRDGFVIVDIDAGTVESRILVRGATTTGVAVDGESLALTLARGFGVDNFARPLLRHGFRRIDLTSLAITADTSVPGALIALDGDLVYTSEEMWDVGWAVDSNIVVSRLQPGRAKVLDRRKLEGGAFDLRVAGSTLYYTLGNGYTIDLSLSDSFSPWFPATEIRTLRLGTTLVDGPTIDVGNAFASLLLVEENGALVVENGVTVERFDVTGPGAVSQWSRDVGIFPRSARADEPVGSYLLALGLGGLARVP